MLFMKDHKVSIAAIHDDKTFVEKDTILATNFCYPGTQVNPSIY